MKSWLANFSGAVGVSAVAATFGLIGAILVLRVLNPDQAGQYTLIISTATFIGTASLFGQPNLINRLYARSKTPYHWPRDLLNSILLSSTVALLCIVPVLVFYKTTPFEVGFLAAFSILTALVAISATMLNSNRHYVWAALLLRLTNALFVLPVVLSAAGYLQSGVNPFLIYQLAIAAACGLIGLVGLAVYMPSGVDPIPTEERKELLGMAVLVFTVLLFDPGLIVVAGYRLPPASIAGFSGYFNLLGPFQLVWSLLAQTISVEFGRNPSFPKRKILVGLWGLALPVVALGWLVLPHLVDLLYKGKYNAYAGIALPISLMGALLLVEAVPRGYVTALTDNLTLRRYIRAQALLALIIGGVEIFMMSRFEVYGVAWAGVILLLGRNLIAYSYFLITRSQRSSSA